MLGTNDRGLLYKSQDVQDVNGTYLKICFEDTLTMLCAVVYGEKEEHIVQLGG